MYEKITLEIVNFHINNFNYVLESSITQRTTLWNTCVHTNDNESLWCDAKRKFKAMNGCSLTSNIPTTYLDEWIWKRKFGDDERFDACVAAIRRSSLPTDGKQNTTILSS